VLTWRTLFWSISGGMIQDAIPWAGNALLPNPGYMDAYRMVSASTYGRVKELFEQTFGSSMIYLCSNAADLKSPDLRPFIDRYVRGSGGKTAEERIKLMKLVWDAIASEFGGRHELYERNYAGNWEDVRLQRLIGVTMSGEAEKMKGSSSAASPSMTSKGGRCPAT
jgi:aromatic ring hydroxylase